MLNNVVQDLPNIDFLTSFVFLISRNLLFSFLFQ